MKKLIIDRGSWVNGRYAQDKNLTTKVGPSRLVNSNGYKCCLGFYCEQAGVPTSQLVGIGSPANLMLDYRTAWFRKLTTPMPEGGSFYNHAMLLNDSSSITDEERERRLIGIFSQMLDMEVIFVGDYPVFESSS